MHTWHELFTRQIPRSGKFHLISLLYELEEGLFKIEIGPHLIFSARNCDVDLKAFDTRENEWSRNRQLIVLPEDHTFYLDAFGRLNYVQCVRDIGWSIGAVMPQHANYAEFAYRLRMDPNFKLHMRVYTHVATEVSG